MSMIFHPQRSIAITDRSSIGEARRVSSQIAERARIKEVELGRVPLIVTELATNLLLHATGGEIIIRMLPTRGGPRSRNNRARSRPGDSRRATLHD